MIEVQGLKGGDGLQDLCFVRHGQRCQAAPAIERIGQALKPDLLGQKHLAGERRVRPRACVPPADKLMDLDDVLEMGGVQEQDAGEAAVCQWVE